MPYIPAVRVRPLTRYCDPAVARLIQQRAFKTRLVDDAGALADLRVLEVSYGTGTLTRPLKRSHPVVVVAGAGTVAGTDRLVRAARHFRSCGLRRTLGGCRFTVAVAPGNRTDTSGAPNAPSKHGLLWCESGYFVDSGGEPRAVQNGANGVPEFFGVVRLVDVAVNGLSL